MNQNNAAKLLNELVQHQTNLWTRADMLTKRANDLQNQIDELQRQIHKQDRQIAELQWMCKRIRQALYGVMVWIMLGSAVGMILAFI